LTDSLFGNPHSASASSQLASRRIDDTRLQVLQFFNASPDDFDVIFVANATAAIKLVADAFRDQPDGFWYGYHADAHTSLIGVRELAQHGSRCFANDGEVEQWLFSESTKQENGLQLLAYPGQSNMTGRRLPWKWCEEARKPCLSLRQRFYTLYDAAGLVSTSHLDLSDASSAPNFTVLSFYKIFGFPDLGALIVRKDSGHILRQRKYFGGGTVHMVMTFDQQWHAKKTGSLHGCLEDGTLPFHSIIALDSALRVHADLYGSMENISRHTRYLSAILYDRLTKLRHANGRIVCKIYSPSPSEHSVGAIIAFNLQDSTGRWISNSEVEKLGNVKGIQFRTGGLCNPGGIANCLDLTSDDMRQNFAAGQRCGGENDIFRGKPTGVIRVSLGAMSNLKDIDTFTKFMDEFYVDHGPSVGTTIAPPGLARLQQPHFVVEALSVFPIKSCAAFKVPTGMAWEVRDRGLAWDREWCLVHQGTSVALSQKRYPRMALLQSQIDPSRGLLRISHNIEGTAQKSLDVGLGRFGTSTQKLRTCDRYINHESSVCGENVDVQIYTSVHIANFFTEALDVPCTLARYPQGALRYSNIRRPASQRGLETSQPRSIMLANESPILLVSRSSVNRLNEQIKHNGGVGKAVTADSFRGNITIAEELVGGQAESPYVEDEWTCVTIGDKTQHSDFEILGPCQRCQMVCVDQKSAQRREEPFSTLAKTRRKDGKVWFGMHLCLTSYSGNEVVKIKAGDRVVPQIL